jgi:hypothetical protein
MINVQLMKNKLTSGTPTLDGHYSKIREKVYSQVFIHIGDQVASCLNIIRDEGDDEWTD